MTQPSTEAIAAASPSQTQLLSFSSGFPPGWIKYQLAEKGIVRFDIEELDGSTWTVKKIIDQGYWSESPAGFFKREAWEALTDDKKLWGTAAYWDERVDTMSGREPTGIGTYRVRMYVNETEVAGSPIQFTI